MINSSCSPISGPWAKKFMEMLGIDLPFRTIRNETLYWKAHALPNNGRSNFKIIIVSEKSEELYGAYILPEYEYPGLIKVKVK